MKDGSTKKEWHYEFRTSILCDARYGLPIKWNVKPANNSEQKELDKIIEEMAKCEERYKLERMENLMAYA